MQQRKFSNAIPVLGILVFYIVVVYSQLFTPGKIVRMSDFIFPNINNKTNLDLFLYSWTNYGFGQPNIPSLSMVIIYLLSLMFGAPLAQQVFGYAPLLLGSLGMYCFLIKTNWVKSRFWAFIISILYVVNWAVFSYEGDNASLFTVTGLMWTYSAIPLFSIFAYRMYIESKISIRNVVALSLMSWVASICNSQALVMLGVVMIPFIFYFTINRIILASEDKWKSLFQLILSLAGWGFICFLLVFPIVMQLMSSILLSGNVQSLYGGKATLMPIGPLYNYIFPSLISPFLILTAPFIINEPISLIGICVPIIIFFGIFLETDNKKKLFALLVFALLLIADAWINMVIQQALLVKVVYHLPIFGQLMQVCRSPFKYFVFLAPAVTLLFALGINNIVQKMKLSNPLSSFWKSILICGALGSIFFNHNGRIFQLRAVFLDTRTTFSGQGGDHMTPFGHLDSLNEKVGKELGKFGDTFDRILWVPNENEIWAQMTQMNYNNVLSYPSVASLGYYQDEISKALSDGSKSRLAKILSLLNIRYIVVLKYLKQTGPPRIWGNVPWGEHIVGDPVGMIFAINNQKNISLITETESYCLYENKLLQRPLSKENTI